MLRPSIIVTFLALACSFLGFIVQLLLAKRYGVGVEVDAYLFSISFPTFFAGVVSAIFSFNLIPQIVSAQSDAVHHRNFIGTILIGVFAISFVVSIVMSGGMLLLSDYFLTAKSHVYHYDDLKILMILACLVGAAQIVQGCLSAILNSEKNYIKNSLITLLPYAGMLLLLLVLGKSMGIKILLIGLLSGTLFSIFLSVIFLRRLIFPIPWRYISWNTLLKLTRNSIYTALAMTCFSAYSIVDAYWGPRAGDGTLASLGYAQRLVIAVGNLAVAGPSAILVPDFTEYLRNKNYDGFKKLLCHGLIFVASVAISVALFLGVFAFAIVQLLFGYDAFGLDQVLIVTSTIQNMAPGMVAMLLSVIGMRVLFCFDSAHKIAAIFGIGWIVGYFFASSFAYQYGAPGIALAYSAIWIIFLFALSALIYTKTRRFNA